MKIVKAQEMARIEKLAYGKGFSEESFMNAAGEGVAEAAQQMIARMHLKPVVILLCGSGNNAGDGFVAGQILQEGGFKTIALSLAKTEECSPLCQLQSRRFLSSGGTISQIKSADEIHFDGAGILIDGILGTGFHGEVRGLYHSMIEMANHSNIPILSIDIPSGINGDTGEIGGTAIIATETLFLGLPKTGCFLGDVWNFTGKIDVYDFGLKEEFIRAAHEDFNLIDDDLVHSLMPPIIRTRHKYSAGYVVGIGGSQGMPGAPILSSFASLRAGAGIVRLLHPEGMEGELAGAPYEVIRQSYQEGGTGILEAVEKASAVFVGPGIGTGQSALSMLKNILPKLDKPCVIDAEALTLIAKHTLPLPKQTILTPHHGEMKRLLGIEEQIEITDFIGRCQKFTEEKNVILVLKGAPTFIFHPTAKPYICARGDPGMATAGSGDVLTGVIAAFLAQVGDPLHAAILGVQFHAIAGERAAAGKTSYSMVASDITEALPWVFEAYTQEYSRYQAVSRAIPSFSGV